MSELQVAASAIVTRRMGSGALFRSVSGAVLLVRPTYKSTWEIPGGTIEPGESPRSCCTRELLEELGLNLPIGRLLVMDWLPPAPSEPDGWMFVYDGGVLGEDIASRIQLPPEELLEWRFVEIGDVERHLSAPMARRVRVAYDCAVGGLTVDLEWGSVPGSLP